jgi:hypothetical protein
MFINLNPYWTSYPWYFEPPIQGILDPLPIVYRTHCSLYFNPLHMVYQSHYPWYFGSRVQYTIWNFGTRVKFSSLYFESNHGSGFDIPLVRWVVGPKYHGWWVRCNTLTMVCRNPSYAIMKPLHMIYRTTYSWHIERPIHGISNHLPMVFLPPPSHGKEKTQNWNIN